MIDTESFLRQAESDLRSGGPLSEASLGALEGLPPDRRAAFARSLGFLGRPGAPAAAEGAATSEADRVAASRLMLLKLGLPGGDPRWSSRMLGAMVDAACATPGGGPEDLYLALYDLLGPSRLTATLANFVKDLVVLGFTRDRDRYRAIDWARLLGPGAGARSAAQWYFLLLAVPPEQLPGPTAEALRESLGSTSFRDEAYNLLDR